MFNLRFREQAAKQLTKLNQPYFSSVREALSALEHNYFPPGKNCKRLQGKEKDLFRIRIGTYRALYRVDHKKKIITVLKIFNRNEEY